MSGTVQSSQVVFSIDKSGAKPDCDADQRRLRGHLTKGWDGSTWKDDAITWRATVPTTLNSAELQSWDFGFVQIAEATKFQSFYSSRIRSEGAISLDYFVPPALMNPVLLDNGERAAPAPWYRTPSGTIVGRGIQSASGDHPGLIVPLTLENRVCSYVKNYLFHVIMDRRFWTVFAARPPKGAIQYIGHFAWRLRYEFKFVWRNDTIKLASNASIVDVPSVGTVGRPTEASIQSLLDSPAGPLANEAGDRAILITESGSPPVRRDLPERFFNTPSDFWLKS